MRRLALYVFALVVAGCSFHPTLSDSPDAATPPGGDGASTGCPAAKAGAGCILALHDRAIANCDAAAVGELRRELDLRKDLGPLWADGRALFRTDQPTHVAGSFNNWSATEVATTAFCGTDLTLAVANVASGVWQYKLTDGQTWTLDPHDPAFAYDDFTGNPDGRNSVLATPDSGHGYLVELDRACSSALGNCRDVTAYLPPGYDALANVDQRYPVLFMHDGQNLWDDHDCCFGHTGWEVNVTLDAEIAAGRVAPLIVIGAASTPARNNEYGLSPSTMATFMKFQVEELQPHALAQVRWNTERVGIAGSSLGGLVAMHLAMTYPQTYAAGASLSGAFWPGQDNGTAFRDRLPIYGKQAVAIYLDHGGNPADNSDGAADTIEVRDRMTSMGWQRSDSLACAPGPNVLCYFTQPGATHDELAWKARVFRVFRFLYPR